MFSFQSNENSVQVRVALLLYTALTHHANLMGVSTSVAVDRILWKIATILPHKSKYVEV